jgi:hypothetical protein
MSLTVDQILALAPDVSARKAGQDLAKRATWSGLGRAGATIFGEVEGIVASPYRTIVDPAKAADQMQGTTRYPGLGLSPAKLPNGTSTGLATYAGTRGRLMLAKSRRSASEIVTPMVTLAATGERSTLRLAARGWETLIGGAIGLAAALIVLPPQPRQNIRS